jgi:hypothetical protein
MLVPVFHYWSYKVKFYLLVFLGTLLQFLTMLLTEYSSIETQEPNLVRVWIIAFAMNPKTYFTESVILGNGDKEEVNTHSPN